VKKMTTGIKFWLVLLLTFPCSTLWAKVPAADTPQVTVSIYNDAGIPSRSLLGAESEASRIFRQSGLELRWLNCPLPAAVLENPADCATADFPHHLQLRVATRSLNLNEFTMGISYLSADGTGCCADVFYERARQIHESNNVPVAAVLGHAIAHEIGHLLLGTNSHSATGIMRARWQPAELARVSKGRLFFSTIEAQEMRNKLAAMHTEAKDSSHIAAAPLGD